MDVNDNACSLNKRVALESIASKLGSYKKAIWFNELFLGL